MEDIVEKSTDLLVKHIGQDFNILKVVEECAELQEVMIKYLTKNENLKPPLSKIYEEMGDVIFRIIVVSKALGIEDEVQGRIEYKSQMMYDWAVNKFINKK